MAVFEYQKQAIFNMTIVMLTLAFGIQKKTSIAHRYFEMSKASHLQHGCF
jgi:hypothetical protein